MQMNKKATLLYFFITFSSTFQINAQIITKNVPETIQSTSLDGRVFQILLFAKDYLDSASLEAIKNDPNSSYQQPLTNNRVVLNFKDGSLEPSWVSDKKFDACTTPLITLEGNLIAFTTNCSSADPDVKAVWSGIIKKSNIQGTFCWQLPGGKLVCFVFYGSESKRDREPEEKSDNVTLLN